MLFRVRFGRQQIKQRGPCCFCFSWGKALTTGEGGMEGEIFLPTAESCGYKQNHQICQSRFEINVLLILEKDLPIESNSNTIRNHLLPELLNVKYVLLVIAYLTVMAFFFLMLNVLILHFIEILGEYIFNLRHAYTFTPIHSYAHTCIFMNELFTFFIFYFFF